MLSGWHPARCQSVSSITWPARQLIETTDCRANVASPSTRVQERIDPGGCRSWPLILCRRDYMSWLPKISSRSFIQNCCWTTLQVSRHPGRKRLVSKMKGITNFSRCLKQLSSTLISRQDLKQVAFVIPSARPQLGCAHAQLKRGATNRLWRSHHFWRK